MTIVLKGWLEQNGRLIKDFKFKGFTSAIAFMVEVASFCQTQDHHPEWTNIYNTVHVELTTHETKGVTDKDVKLAAHMDKIFEKA